MVARDEDAVAEQAEVPVRVAREVDDAPAGDLVALLQRLRVADEADQRAVERGLAADLGGLALREPVLGEVVGEPPDQSGRPHTSAQRS